MPVVRMVERLMSAAATPIRRLAVDRRPSLAPSTPARSQPTRPLAWRLPMGSGHACARHTAMVGPWVMTAIESSPDAASALPHWDPTDVFPSLRSRELTAARERLGAELDRLVASYDEHGVGECEPHAPSAEEVAALEAVLTATNALEQEHAVVDAFVASFVSTDSRNDAAQGIASSLQRDAATHAPAGRPTGGMGGRPRPRRPGRGQPARRRPCLPPPAGRGPGRAPDARATGGALRRAGDDRVVGVGPAARATSRRSSRADVTLPDGTRRGGADHRGAGPGHQRRSGGAPGRVSTPNCGRGPPWPRRAPPP